MITSSGQGKGCFRPRRRANEKSRQEHPAKSAKAQKRSTKTLNEFMGEDERFVSMRVCGIHTRIKKSMAKETTKDTQYLGRMRVPIYIYHYYYYYWESHILKKQPKNLCS